MNEQPSQEDVKDTERAQGEQARAESARAQAQPHPAKFPLHSQPRQEQPNVRAFDEAKSKADAEAKANEANAVAKAKADAEKAKERELAHDAKARHMNSLPEHERVRQADLEKHNAETERLVKELRARREGEAQAQASVRRF